MGHGPSCKDAPKNCPGAPREPRAAPGGPWAPPAHSRRLQQPREGDEGQGCSREGPGRGCCRLSSSQPHPREVSSSQDKNAAPGTAGMSPWTAAAGLGALLSPPDSPAAPLCLILLLSAPLCLLFMLSSYNFKRKKEVKSQLLCQWYFSLFLFVFFFFHLQHL